MNQCTATIIFPNIEMAETFAILWGRHSLAGHTIHNGSNDVNVTIYGVTEQNKLWINSTINNLNKQFN